MLLRLIHLCLFLLLMSCQVLHLAAQNRCTLTGVVRDTEGQTIELAAVRIEGKPILTTTDLSGNYKLSFATADTIVVVCSMIGYETRKHTLIAPRDSSRVDFVLPPYGQMLGEAVATARHVQSGTTQKIDISAHRNTPSTTGNGVEEIIATQAGVSTHNELSSQYNVRGGSFDENVVYINGIEVYRPMLIRSGQQEGLSMINRDMVESVAFSSGGFEARYGDKMSSVLDITYKRPTAFEASLMTSMLGANSYVGWGNKQVALMASLRYKTTRYLLGSLDTEGEYRPNFLDHQFFLTWTPSHRWTLELLGNVADNHYGFVPKDRATRFGTMYDAKSFKVYFDGQEQDHFRTLFGAATLTRHFTPDTYVALKASSFNTREHETYDIQGQYWLHDVTAQEELGVGTYMEHARNRLHAQVNNIGWRARTRWQQHTLQAGMDWRIEHVRERSKEWEMRDSMGYSLPHHPDELKLIYALRSHNQMRVHKWEAFVQDTWRKTLSSGLLNLTYGLRLSHSDWNAQTLLSPRLSIGFLPQANDRWVFRAATGLYYQMPFYKELRDTTLRNGIAEVSLNPNVRSQQSIHFVIGSDYTFRMGNRPFKFTTELYYKSLRHLIPYTVDNVRVVYDGRHLSKGYATGIDFKLFGEFVPGTDSWLTFSLMKTQERLMGKWIPRPTDQRYNLSLYFTDYFPGSQRWTVTLKAALAAGLPFAAPHSQKTEHTFRAPAYKRVDIGLNYHLFSVQLKEGRRPIRGAGRYLRNVWLGIDCFNLLGVKNVNSYYWVTDINDARHAVPNYLTGRQLNLRLSLDF